MFSRSEKTEEVAEALAEPSDQQRSPMVLAALAGLLAIAGAFLLVWYLGNSGGDEAVSDSPGTAIINEDGTVATNGNESGDQATRQVLVVTQTIPQGTSVNELIAAPTVYLSARAVPEQFVTASAITSVAELQELEGQVLASDILAGEQLLRGRFRNPNDFSSGEDTFLETETNIEVPPGHHAVVLELPAARAMGGNIRAGELVTIVMNGRVTPEGNRQGREVSIVVLNEAEVLNIQSTLEVAGEFGEQFNQIGTASRGSFTITIAVKPEELADVTYAIGYGEIVLATAVEGLDNDGPRAVTTIRQIAGDDGIWVGELEDGNIVELVEIFPPEAGLDAAGTSIEVEIAPDEDDRLGEEAAPADDADLLVEGESDG